MFAVQRFYHASPALSTPHRRSLGHPHPPHLPLSYGDFRGLENENSYTIKQAIPTLSRIGVLYNSTNPLHPGYWQETQAAVFDIAHLLRVATRKHLGHQAIVIGRLVARMGVCKPVPVLGKDLLEDIPVPRGCCNHQVAPS